MSYITLFDKSFEELKALKLNISCSCGKDSVCVALLLHEKNIPVYSITRYLNGSDWSCMEQIWERLKEVYSDTDTIFVELKGTDLLKQFEEPHYYKLDGKQYKGFVPCGVYSRYGTNEKIQMLEAYTRENQCTDVIGIAYGENRVLKDNACYPLVEKKITEPIALKCCYKYGFYWEQLTDYGFTIRMYNYCTRLSCIYCSFCNADQLALIIAYFPSVYKTICDIQLKSDVPFKPWSSAFNLPFKLKNKIELLRKEKNFIRSK